MSYAKDLEFFEARKVRVVDALNRATEDQLRAIERVLGLRKPDEAADVVDRIVEWERRRS